MLITFGICYVYGCCVATEKREIIFYESCNYYSGESIVKKEKILDGKKYKEEVWKIKMQFCCWIYS